MGRCKLNFRELDHFTSQPFIYSIYNCTHTNTVQSTHTHKHTHVHTHTHCVQATRCTCRMPLERWRMMALRVLNQVRRWGRRTPSSSGRSPEEGDRGVNSAPSPRSAVTQEDRVAYTHVCSMCHHVVQNYQLAAGSDSNKFSLIIFVTIVDKFYVVYQATAQHCLMSHLSTCTLCSHMSPGNGYTCVHML